MSQKKHLHVLSELSAHPIARNLEWKDVIPALESIGLLHADSNNTYELTRNDHKVVFERSPRKTLDIGEVLKLRHFLRDSSHSDHVDANLEHAAVIAVDYHNTTIIHNPGTKEESTQKIHADLSSGREVHRPPTAAPFHDNNPVFSPEYFEAVIKVMEKSPKNVILSHGTGTSDAGEKLLEIITDKHSEVLHTIVAVKKCDLEAMTEPQISVLGASLLGATEERED